jgi:hypothetical protein
VAKAPGALEHEEWKPAIARNQPDSAHGRDVPAGVSAIPPEWPGPTSKLEAENGVMRYDQFIRRILWVLAQAEPAQRLPRSGGRRDKDE